ncbi:hypothetical protein Ntsu_80660 [Nocardia sp. IFM 10818]
MRRLLVVFAVAATLFVAAPVSALAQPTTTAPAAPTTTTPITATSAPATTAPPTATTTAGAPVTKSTEANDLYAQCRNQAGTDIPIFGKLIEWDCDIKTAILNPGEAAGEALSGAVGKAADELAQGWKNGIALMFSWWYRTPITGAISADSSGTCTTGTDGQISCPTSGASNLVDTVHSYLRYFQIGVFVVSVGLALVRIAWAQAGQRGQHVMEAVTLAKRSVLVSSTVAGLAVLGDGAMRSTATWILAGLAGEVDPNTALDRIMKISTLGGYLGAGLLFVLALLGLVGVIAQMMFILVQIAVSNLVLGVLPLAAAASGTEAGRQAYRKLIAWVTVFVLFPPATAIVYGTAFALAFASDDAQGTLAGMILLTLSALTLPSLVRLLVPMAGQMAGASGAAALGGAVLATGAVPLAQSAISGSGGGGERPASSGGRSDGDRPTGAVSTPSGSQSSTSGGGGGGAAGGAPSSAGASGAAASGGGAAAGASGAAAAGGPAGMAAMAAVEGVKKVADGARNSVGSPEPPPPAGPTGGVPPSGGRSDGN